MTPGAPRPATTSRVCSGPVAYTAHAQIASDLASLNAALAGKDVEGFVAALGPLSLGAGSRNENVPAGTDCGIGSRVGHEAVVWAKLQSMVEGARRASHVLWGD
jgi:hypothetical protein